MKAAMAILSDFLGTDREQCGIIVASIETGTITRVVEVTNYAENPRDNYSITKKDLEAVEGSLRKGEYVLGFLHTHLEHQSSEPSDNDFLGANIYPELLNCVYKPSTGELIWYGAT